MEIRKKINRTYKDRLFRLVFKEKKDLLDLYNAINETSYTDENKLIINTLDNVVYMGVKNDISFIISDILNLYEHQSTLNPNMPVRDLIYLADVYSGYIEDNQLDVYRSALVKLPLPQYIVFYNGVANVPDKMELNLSDAIDVQDKPSCLEFTATMININWGHSEHLLDTCKKLGEYSRLVDMVRKYKSTGLTMEEAVEIAVEEAINKDILRELLRHNQGEVVSMFLREYNEQEHIENEKNISWQDGREEGREEGD